MFNKNIFICWFQGQQHLNTHSKARIFNENVKNWQILNPSWKLHFVSNDELRNACKTFSKECLETYDSFDLLHLKIDLGRYVLLYLYGGIYVDMDMYVLRGLHTSIIINSLIKKASKKHILGLSSLNLDTHESLLFIGKQQVLNNAMMLSTPKHPLISLMIKSVISNYKKQTAFENNSYDIIQNITGPVFMNKFFSNYINTPSLFHIHVFPHYFFEPSPAYGNSDIREETIAIHKMEMSWVPSHLKHFINFYYKIKPYIFIPIIFLIVKQKYI
jgi:mannosyltransferase OCH1-like enzyme